MAEIGLVTLKVFGVLGRELATVVKESKRPGEYPTLFNASRLSSGGYFYDFRVREKRDEK